MKLTLAYLVVENDCGNIEHMVFHNHEDAVAYFKQRVERHMEYDADIYDRTLEEMVEDEEADFGNEGVCIRDCWIAG